jgi:hypothetical protein
LLEDEFRPAFGEIRGTPLAQLTPRGRHLPKAQLRTRRGAPAFRRLGQVHSPDRDRSHRLWSLPMLEFSFREFIDGDASEEPLEYAVLRAA